MKHFQSKRTAMASSVKYARVKSTIIDEEDENYNSGDDDENNFPSVQIYTKEQNASTQSKHSVDQKNILRTVSINGLLILCYFILSIGLTFYQRWLLKGYKFPFSMVIYHLFIKLVLSCLVRIFYRVFTGKRRVTLPTSAVLKQVAPTSFFGAIDIGFSQWGLEFVEVALYTMTKSTVIIFISFFAVLFRLEKKSCTLLVIVVMISAGLFLFTFKSTEFNLLGFILLLIASLSSGARWTLAQLLMQKSKLGLHNPIDMIFYMQPYMLISLIPFAIIFESERLLSHVNQLFDLEYYELLILWLKISIGAFLAFFMEISEFLVLAQTSSLTLSISGIFKEIMQLVLAVELTGEVLSSYNIAGLVLCLGGITSHVIHKYWTLTDPKNERIDEGPEKHIFDLNGQTSSGFKFPDNKDGKVSSRNGTSVIMTHSKAPLLYDDFSQGESDESNDESKSAQVLFDILKRRENETR